MATVFASTTSTDIGDIIKEFYPGEGIAKAIVSPLTTWRILSQRGRGSMVKRYVASLKKLVVGSRFATPGGAGQSASDGALPQVNGGDTTRKFTLGMGPLWLRLIIDEEVMDSDDADLMTNEVRDQMSLIITTMQRTLNRVLTGAGSGILANVTAEESGDQDSDLFALTVDDTGAVPQGQKIDVWSVAPTRVATAAQVVGANVPSGPGQVYLQCASTPTFGTMTGGTLRVQNSDQDDSVYGLQAQIDDDTAYPAPGVSGAVDRTSYANVMYRSAKRDGSTWSGPVYELLEDVIRTLGMDGGIVEGHDEKQGANGPKLASWCLLDPQALSAVTRSLRDDSMYVNKQRIDLGFHAETLDGVPLIPERDLPPGMALFLNSRCWHFYEKKHKWRAGGDRNGIFYVVPGFDFNEASGMCKHQIFCDNPMQQGRIENINTDNIGRGHTASATV